MEPKYENYILISITDKYGKHHSDSWRDKYLNHTGEILFIEDKEYPGSTRMVFSSYKGGGLICSPGKKHIENDKIVATTTNSIYTFEREKK